MPNGGQGDLFQVRKRDDGWEIVFLDPYPSAELRERVLARGLDDFAAADDFMWGAINGFDDPDATALGEGEYRAGMEAGRALRLERRSWV